MSLTCINLRQCVCRLRSQRQSDKCESMKLVRTHNRIPAYFQSQRRSYSHISQNTSAKGDFLQTFQTKLDNSLIRELEPDPKSKECFPNQRERAVLSGHYVAVQPTPLNQPKLLAYSKDVLEAVECCPEEAKSKSFLQLFSGNVKNLSSWATPYAVSVFGNPILSPDKHNGYAYGDGRAISLGEMVNSKGERFEIQMKGAGPTPFSRSFDGRSVLRSSVREFLVSEAMHHLRVPTTRALCLIQSESDFVPRAWYEEDQSSASNPFPPNRLVEERCAITTRVSSSFLRVGHVELYARRIGLDKPKARCELNQLLRHIVKREFPSISITEDSETEVKPEELLQVVREFSYRQADLVTAWKRVGYVQGNMNSDNCLFSGNTMDYGPFGFMEKYDPLWTPFTSDPAKNFGFEKQDVAAQVNILTLVQSLARFVGEEDVNFAKEARKIVQDDFAEYYFKQRDLMRMSKLGLKEWREDLNENLWHPLYRILMDFDYTIFWRQLSTAYSWDCIDKSDEDLVAPLRMAVYSDALQSVEQRKQVCDWIRLWLRECKNQDSSNPNPDRQAMLEANPKYIPREWMLREAYVNAEEGNLEPLRKLQKLFETPYSEHKDLEKEYFSKTPMDLNGKPGIAFYS